MRRVSIFGIMVCERFFLFTNQAAMAVNFWVAHDWLFVWKNNFRFYHVSLLYMQMHFFSSAGMIRLKQTLKQTSMPMPLRKHLIVAQYPWNRIRPWPVHCYLEYINNSGPPSPLSDQDSPFTKRFKSWFWEQGQHGSASSCMDLISSEDDLCLCLSVFFPTSTNDVCLFRSECMLHAAEFCLSCRKKQFPVHLILLWTWTGQMRCPHLD